MAGEKLLKDYQGVGEELPEDSQVVGEQLEGDDCENSLQGVHCPGNLVVERYVVMFIFSIISEPLGNVQPAQPSRYRLPL